jgi:hemerythrin superfamily protein
MADNLSLRGEQDRQRINVHEAHEVSYWSKKFGVTAAKLQEAVASVGVMASAVEGFFSTKPAEPTGAKSPRRAIAKKAMPVRQPDAIALLRADHKRVSDLFDQFEKTRSASKKKSLVAQICVELTVHAQIEEELFYPAVKAALKDKELVPEATVEHASVKDLIAQVRGIEPDGEMYDAKVKVMSEFVKHHVKEEQNEMFPKAKGTRLDMVELGEQLAARKEQLMAAGV